MLNKTNLTWDVNGHRGNSYFYLQRDWYQTIITRINECSSQILQSSCNGANIIEISPNVECIFDSLEYYNSYEKTIGAKKVIINPDTASMVKLYNSSDKSNYRIIEILGLSEPFKSDETNDFMYLLINR